MGRIPHCHVTLREKLLMDAGAIAGFLTGLCMYLDDPAKVKRLLLPTKLSGGDDGKKVYRNGESSPSVANLQKEIPVTILLIRILNHLQMAVELSGPWNLIGIIGNRTCTLSIQDRLDPGTDEGTNASTVQSSDMNGVVYLIKLLVDCLFVHLRHPLLVFQKVLPFALSFRRTVQSSPRSFLG